MEKLRKKRILITQPILHSFCGSTLVTIELAEYLKKIGAFVEVYSYTFDEPIKKEFEIRNIKVHVADDDINLDLFSYDYIWIHSQVFPESMTKQLPFLNNRNGKKPTFIFLHMSAHDYIPDEFQWIYSFEDKISDLSLFISEETELRNKPLFESNVRTDYYRNPAPMSYKGVKKSTALEKILIVSNHAPDEVEEASNILKSNNICVDHLGENGSRYGLICPDDISNYDAIITIGKTVQYCIIGEKPVYIYDTFGGPGYLRINNFEKAKMKNFSGRGFEKKTAELIADEIMNKWSVAQKDITKISKNHSNDYRIDTVIKRIFDNIQPREKDSISESQALSIFYSQRLARYRFSDAYLSRIREQRIQSCEKEIQRLNNIIQSFPKDSILHRTEKYLIRSAKKIPRKIHSIVKPKKICLALCVYNEEANLPLYLKHIEPYVDFIVALDDGSTDNTKEVLKSSKKLKKLIENPRKEEINEWNELENREKLLAAAKNNGADWIIALDPDERFEKNFLKSLRKIVESSDQRTVYGLRFRELWDSYDQFRSDGIWGQKVRYCLFPINHNIRYKNRNQKLHHRWYPDDLVGHEFLLDYDMYHLKMINPESRKQRAKLYKILDPEKKYQSIGYDYLIDEKNIRIDKIDPNHGYDVNSINTEYY